MIGKIKEWKKQLVINKLDKLLLYKIRVMQMIFILIQFVSNCVKFALFTTYFFDMRFTKSRLHFDSNKILN